MRCENEMKIKIHRAKLNWARVILRTVSVFATAHAVYYRSDDREINYYAFLTQIQRYFTCFIIRVSYYLFFSLFILFDISMSIGNEFGSIEIDF